MLSLHQAYKVRSTVLDIIALFHLEDTDMDNAFYRVIVDENGIVTGYKGTAPTHVHTIDPVKSELYGGQQVTHVAPSTRCGRIADYHRAGAHFDKIFN